MSAPYRTAMSQGQRLKADAAVAAEVRNYRTDPDVVALKVERARVLGDRFIWASMGILLVFAMVTVQRFVARDAPVGSLEWAGAWFLEPGIVAGLVGVLIWESLTTRWLPAGEAVGPWTRAAKWGLLGCTYAMNTWYAWAGLDGYGIVAHSIPPVGVFVLTECRVEMLTKLERCVVAAHEYTQRRNTERAAREQADREKREAEQVPSGKVSPTGLPPETAPVVPIAPAAPPRFAPAVRPDPAPTDRVAPSPGDDPAPTDEQLIRQLWAMADQDGGRPPSQYAARQALGVGGPRAARLLAQLREGVGRDLPANST